MAMFSYFDESARAVALPIPVEAPIIIAVFNGLSSG
jgi:hypothetical protein